MKEVSPAPPPEAIPLMVPPFAPLGAPRIWCHAQVLRVGVILAPKARTVAVAWRVMGLAAERRLTHDQLLLNRATASACPGRKMQVALLIPFASPAMAIVL